MIDKKFDLSSWVGWSQDRLSRSVARSTDVIITTLDQGISLQANLTAMASEGGMVEDSFMGGCQYGDHESILYKNAREQSNRASKDARCTQPLVCVCQTTKVRSVKTTLKMQVEKESPFNDRYDFESILDECGYGYLQKLKICNARTNVAGSMELANFKESIAKSSIVIIN